jgi:[acyl-carrier-protein] S-malonyltransferase
MSLLIAFSGQGFQQANMFEPLIDNAFGQQWLLNASNLLKIDLFDKHVLETYCFDRRYNQLLIVISSVGIMYALQRELAFKSMIFSGYSVGDLSAFCASGQLTLPVIVRLIKKRTNVMYQATFDATNGQSCGLMVLKGYLNHTVVTDLCRKNACYIAIINDSDHYVVGGLTTHLDALLIDAQTIGVGYVAHLAVTLPSHTPLLQDADIKFLTYLNRFCAYRLHVPILNALNGQLITTTSELLPLLAKELSTTLRWDKTMQIAPEYGINCFLEIGPGQRLKKMFSNYHPDIPAYSLEDFSSLKGLVNFFNKKHT